MPAKAVIILATGAYLAVAGAFGWLAVRSARGAETVLASLNRETAQLATAVRQAREKSATRHGVIADLQAKLRSTGQATSAKSIPAPLDRNPTPLEKAVAGKGPAMRMAPAGSSEMTPDGRAIALRNWRLFTPPRIYRLMYHRLGLTEEQITKFEDLATEHQDDLLTLQQAATKQGFNATDSLSGGLESMIKRSNEEFYARVGRELGPTIGTAVAENDRYFEAQALVTSMEDRLLLVNEPGIVPLTGPQAGRLCEILAECSPAFRNGGNSSLIDLDWDRACAQAATFLTGTQLQAVKAIADLRRLQVQIREFYGPIYLRNDR